MPEGLESGQYPLLQAGIPQLFRMTQGNRYVFLCLKGRGKATASVSGQTIALARQHLIQLQS